MLIFSLYVFLISLLLSLAVTSLICRMKEAPAGKISHSGGFAIWLSFLVSSSLAFIFIYPLLPQKREVLGIYLCSGLIFIVGLIDDKRELSVILKFITQLLAAAIVMFFGVRTNIAGIGEPANFVITVLWILGITNAFNHLDIIDGLASGIALVSFFTFYLISVITSNLFVALALIALCGSILGFFRYNYPKAKIYMGNSGSHFLGFIISTLAIMISYASLEKRIALIIPLLILGFPIFDTLFVALIRILKHRPVWQKSKDHLPLRFVALGLSGERTVLSMCLLTFTFCASAIIILYSSKKIGMFILALLVLLCIYIALEAKKIKVDD
mgnify:CR=1 FL=1